MQPGVRGVGVCCRDGLVAQPEADSVRSEKVLPAGSAGKPFPKHVIKPEITTLTTAESMLAPEKTSNVCTRNSDSSTDWSSHRKECDRC
jgi:hypothetical protein